MQPLFPTLNRGKNHKRQCGLLVLWGIFPVHLELLELHGFDQVMKSTLSTGNQLEGISGFDVSFFRLAQLFRAGSHNAKVARSIPVWAICFESWT